MLRSDFWFHFMISDKQLLHSPFMGGGIWTALAVPLVMKAGIYTALIISTVVIFGWILIWALHFRPKYESLCRCQLCSDTDLDSLSINAHIDKSGSRPLLAVSDGL